MNFKNVKIGIVVFAIAIGTAFATNTHKKANEPTAIDNLAQMGYYKIPTNPQECQEFREVPCSPVQTEELCEYVVEGLGLQQIYDENCSPLYKEQQ